MSECSVDGTVLDGELLVWPEGAEQPAPFALLQKRLNRKVLGKKLLAESGLPIIAADTMAEAATKIVAAVK